MQGYNLKFDIASSGLQLEAWMLPLIILPVVGAFLVFQPKLMLRLLPSGLQGRLRIIFSWFFFLFSTTISAIWLTSYLATYLHLRDARVTNGFQTVEGCLQGFHPMPEGGHDSERLLFGGIAFEYSDYTVTPAFNVTEPLGGPIHADSRVRIGYVGPDIVRVETIDNACPKAPDLGRPGK